MTTVILQYCYKGTAGNVSWGFGRVLHLRWAGSFCSKKESDVIRGALNTHAAAGFSSWDSCFCVFSTSHGHYMNISWNVTVLRKQQEICSSLQSMPQNTRNYFSVPFLSECWEHDNTVDLFPTRHCIHLAYGFIQSDLPLYSINPPSSMSQCISFPVHQFCQTEISQLLDGLQYRPTSM